MEEKTRKEYIQNLEKLQGKVAAMGELARAAVEKSLTALFAGDVPLAESVMEGDDAIDDAIVEIEDDCILLIAKQQPIAHDLRVIATGFKISTDIERIGDHAFDIARTAKELEAPIPAGCVPLLRELGDAALWMVDAAMRCYREKDLSLADQVLKKDKEMDTLFEKVFYGLSHIAESPEERGRVTQFFFIARFLERIGDHSVNIAEWVIYLETAERIRHIKSTTKG